MQLKDIDDSIEEYEVEDFLETLSLSHPEIVEKFIREKIKTINGMKYSVVPEDTVGILNKEQTEKLLDYIRDYSYDMVEGGSCSLTLSDLVSNFFNNEICNFAKEDLGNWNEFVQWLMANSVAEGWVNEQYLGEWL